jgi:hypothetical protein
VFKPRAYCCSALISLLIILFFIVPTTTHATQLLPLYQWPIDEEAFVIVNVRVNGRSVVSDLEAYYTQTNKLLLPVSALKSTMGISFKITQSELIATLDDSKHTLNIPIKEANTSQLNDTLWARDDYDHYVELSVINTLLKTEAVFDYSLMQVSFVSSLVSEQSNKTAPYSSKKQVLKPAYEHVIDDEYQTLTYPVSEYALSASYRNKQNRYKGLIRLNSYFDLFHHKAEIRFNKNENTANTFFKVSKDFNLTSQDHSLERIHYQIGDIQSQSDPLIAGASQGMGFYISNANPHSTQNFSAITIEEPALPGWQAELYRNGQFIATTQANDNNLVTFTDIETFYGNNIFEIKLFGPQGEQITRTQKYTIGLDALSPGKISYQVELINSDKSVFGQAASNNSPFSNSFKSIVSYGVNDNVTFDAQLTHLNGDKNSNGYISSGLNILSEHGSYRLLATNQLEAGHALFAGFRGLLSNDLYNDINVNIEYSLLNNFSSALYLPQSTILKNKLLLSLNGKTSMFDSLNWTMRWQNEKRQNTAAKNTYSFGINNNFVGGTWASRLFYNDENNELTNQLYASIDIDSWKLTNTLDWMPSNGNDIVSLSSNLRWPQTQDTFNQTQISYNPSLAASTKLSHQYTYRHDAFNVQLSGQYDSHGDWLLSFGLNGTFSFDHLKTDFVFDTPRSLSAGQIEASSFIDWNENQLFDDGDEPLQDVKFTGNYQWRDKYTNSDGKILLPSSHGGQILDVDLRSLPNPYLQPTRRKIKTNAHRGGQTKVSIPMVIFNEVEGTVYISVNGMSKPAAGITVNLHDKDSDKTYSTVTEYDGYYYFANITQGEYTLSIKNTNTNTSQLSVKNLPEHIITSKTGDTIILQDIVLHTQSSSMLASTPKAPVINANNTAYFVQLGVFKQFESALIVANKVDWNKYPLRLYKHQNRDNYYLVAGPYSNAKKAQTTINAVYSTPALYGSFMVDARRYASLDWQLMGLWETEKANKATLYFCQYAAYTSKKSLKTHVLNANPSLFVLDKNIKGKKHLLMLSGPHKPQQQDACDTNISKQIKELATPIKKSWESIVTLR